MNKVGFLSAVFYENPATWGETLSNLAEAYCQLPGMRVVAVKGNAAELASAPTRAKWTGTFLKIVSFMCLFKPLRFLVILPAAMLALKIYFRSQHTFTIKQGSDPSPEAIADSSLANETLAKVEQAKKKRELRDLTKKMKELSSKVRQDLIDLYQDQTDISIDQISLSVLRRTGLIDACNQIPPLVKTVIEEAIKDTQNKQAAAALLEDPFPKGAHDLNPKVVKILQELSALLSTGDGMVVIDFIDFVHYPESSLDTSSKDSLGSTGLIDADGQVPPLVKAVVLKVTTYARASFEIKKINPYQSQVIFQDGSVCLKGLCQMISRGLCSLENNQSILNKLYNLCQTGRGNLPIEDAELLAQVTQLGWEANKDCLDDDIVGYLRNALTKIGDAVVIVQPTFLWP